MNRKIINTLLMLYVVFTIYNTLIPFRFSYNPTAFKGFVQSFGWKQIFFQLHHGSKTDIIGNLLLFMPFGFLLYLWRQQNRLHMPILYSVIAGFFLSTIIECIQLFFGGRISSATDIVNNTTGTLLGTFAGRIWLEYLVSPVEQFSSRLIKNQPVTLLLLIFLLFQILGAAFPFNVTITVSEVIQGFKQANIVPFKNHSLGLLLLNQPMLFDGTPFRWKDFIGTVLLWVCWGYLIRCCYLLYWKIGKAGLWMAFGLCFFPGILLEGMQIFISSRFCNINDVIGIWGGTIIGVFFFSSTSRIYHFNQGSEHRLAAPIVFVYFFYILYAGLNPFDFDFSATNFASNAGLSILIPFYAYFKATKIWNIEDLLQSLLQFIPIGFYLASMMEKKIKNWKILFFASSIFGLVVSSFLEFIQLFSPTRSADITDVILFGTGGWIGTYFLRYYKNGILHKIRETQWAEQPSGR